MTHMAKIKFPPSFARQIQEGLLAIPNRTFKKTVGRVLIDDKKYCVDLDSTIVQDILNFQQQMHSKTLSDDIRYQMKVAPEDSSDAWLSLTLDLNDIAALIFVIDKITAGAEPVSLDGEIEVRTI